MDQALLQFTSTAFVMLFVVVNPIAIAPIFETAAFPPPPDAVQSAGVQLQADAGEYV